jgi:simple sugar transport system permease protein
MISGGGIKRVATRGVVQWGRALGLAALAFAILLAIKGANPLTVYRSMWNSLHGSTSIDGVLLKAIPLVLAALAVTVPARAGLVNVGGEGQLVIGGVCAAGMSLWVGGSLPGSTTLLLMCVAGAVGGALWSALAVALRLLSGINEALSTLLLNYLAINVMSFLIYSPWKDKHGSGQPATPALPVAERFPLLGTSRVHAGILVAVAAVAVVWWVLRSTRWGFSLRVVGGNPEAARRAGLRVGLLLLSAMLVGGALAGLGGVTQLAGAEFKLRPGFLLTYGYIGFLASWLARHRPLPVALSALALAAISVSGDSLQIDSRMPAATVNVLMALVLLAAFGWTAHAKQKASAGAGAPTSTPAPALPDAVLPNAVLPDATAKAV